MKHRPAILSFISLTVLICFSLRTDAQPSSGILDPTRAIDWTFKGVNGGIQNRTAICSTLNPGATVAQINAAIAACPSGQVVFLTAGTFNLSAGIVFAGTSNVTLRGAGPDKTFLVFSGNDNCIGSPADICVKNRSESIPTNADNTANWTGNYAKGSSSIILDNKNNLTVGSILILDQADDGNTDTGNIWVCATTDVCSTQGPAGVTRTGRMQGQTVVVTSVSSGACPCTIGITPGLYMPNWLGAKTPGAFWATDIVVGVGIEDLSLNHQGSSSALAGIFFANTRDSWVKDVRSLSSNRAHVWLYETARITIRDSYFFGTINAASQSYGIETDVSSDALIENNIFQQVTSPMATGQQTSGNVWGYNFSIKDLYNETPDWMQASSFHHSAGINYNLFEGNDGAGFMADAIHGTSHFMTAFRNRWHGWEVAKILNINGVHIQAYNRYFNVIGNVIGEPSVHNIYECFPASGSSSACVTGPTTTIYMLGWSGNGDKYATLLDDVLLRTMLMRWGNYDTVTGSVHWDSGEVPSGLPLYSNAVPATHNLPPSFYLTAKPPWWRANTPFPPIGPDVTSGSGPAGHSFSIPAQVCYTNTMGGAADGSGSPLPFNASKCYGSAAAPAPPPKLRATAH